MTSEMVVAALDQRITQRVILNGVKDLPSAQWNTLIRLA